MTQLNPLELAKQGDPQAIAQLMNRTLQPKGMTATAQMQGDCLEILLEAAQVPKQQQMMQFVANGLRHLGVQGIQSVHVSGKQSTADTPAWTQTLQLHESSETAAAAPPPPPPRKLADPPPPPAPPMPAPVPATDSAPAPNPSNNGSSPSASYRPKPNPTADGERSPAAVQDSQVTSAKPTTTPATAPAAPASAELDKSPQDEVSQAQAAPPPEATTPAIPQPDPGSDSGSASRDRTKLPTEQGAPAKPNDIPVAHRTLPEPRPLPVPTPPAAEEESEPSQRNGWGWGTVVVVITLFFSFGIIGMTLWRALTSPSTVPTSPGTTAETGSATDSQPATTNPASPSPLPREVNLYATAQDTAQQATNLSSAAQSVDDWNTVARQWRRAIAMLQEIPPDSPDYAAAQEAIATYQANLTTAEQQIANAPESDALPPPTTVTLGSEPTCNPVEPAADAAPLEFSQLSLAAAPEGTEGSIIAGCVTNHSDTPISDILLAYEATSEQLPEFSQNGEQGINVSTIPPGETLFFQSSFVLEPEATNVTINTVSWTPPEATEPQQISPGIAIAR